ncbi:MAG TPA: hypothetical protein VKA87_04590 [Nitrososphaeraceae archaeon]|nr:hypothetical protein [Nitrososphaeraceae archaeon]
MLEPEEMCFAVTIVTASTFASLQAVDGIGFNTAVDTWHAAASHATDG